MEEQQPVQEEAVQQGLEAPSVEEQAAVAAAVAAANAAVQAAAGMPAIDLAQLAQLEIPQLVDYSGAPEQPSLMPAITTLITHISEHLSSPNGNPNLALTFQPLVNMALNLQLRATVPDMRAAAYLSSALATAGVGAGHPAQVQFDPHVLMASATSAAAAGAAPGEGQRQGGGGGGGGRRRQQHSGKEEEEDDDDEEEEEDAADDDDDWRQPWHHKGRERQGGSSARPQRQRKKSRLLQEYLTDDEGVEAEEGQRSRRAAE